MKPQGFGAGTPKTPTQPAERFFSGLQKAITTLKPEKASAAEWKQMLVQPARTVRSAQRDPATNRVVFGEDGKPIMLERTVPEVLPTGVTPEEIEWTGVMDWLDAQQGPVSKADLDAYVRGNGVQVEEVVKGGGVLPNAEEYQRQLLPLIERRDEVIRQIDAEYRDPDGPDFNLISRLEDEGRSLQNQISELENFSGLDGQSDDTKWSSWTLPGGENYTELLLTLPMSEGSVPPGYKLFERDGRWILRYPDEMDVDFATRNEAIASISKKADSFRSSHWDEPNVLAHVRFKDRTGPNGERILAMEEIQSDWHQAGRKQGYKPPAPTEDALAEAQAKAEEAQQKYREITRRLARYRNTDPEFESLLKQADVANNEHREAVAVLNALRGRPNAVPNAPFKNEAWTNLALNRMIRKAAEEGYDGISWIPGNVQNGSIVNAADNRGDFYDKIVVNAANKIGKKYGAKTERLDGLATTKEGTPVSLHYMRVTPDLKRKALEEGFPLFAAAPFAAVGGAGMTMRAESERRTVGRPREKRTVGKAN